MDISSTAINCLLKIQLTLTHNLVLPRRFPLDTGIAGHVATTGLTLNVADVSKDERFNANIDQEVRCCACDCI